jgi:hypothetical protein
VPVKHSLDPYLPLLDVDGTLVMVGQMGPMEEMSTLPLLTGRRRVSGSPIGGIRETQEMLDFCAEKNILPDVEMIRHGRDQPRLRLIGWKRGRRALPLRDRYGLAAALDADVGEPVVDDQLHLHVGILRQHLTQRGPED